MITLLLAATLAAAPAQQLDTTLTVDRQTRVAIENNNGSVTVRSWDRDALRVQSSPARGIDIDRNGSLVRIESDVDWGRRGAVDIEVTVPRRFEVDVEGINLSVTVSDVTGDVTIETANGDVTLTGISGRMGVELVQGELTIRDSRGDADLESANGPVTVVNYEGGIAVEILNGPVTMQQIRSASVQVETVNGPIEYDGQFRDGGRYSFSTHAGSITLFIPENTNAAVSVETWRGEIDSDFPIQVRGIGRRDEMSFTLGTGGARIEIESFGGPVRLRRPGGGGR